jgi:hypothetical protein
MSCSLLLFLFLLNQSKKLILTERNRGGGTGGWFGWLCFLYTFNANAFFLLRSLRYVLLPQESAASGVGGYAPGRSERSLRQSRTYALAGYGGSYLPQTKVIDTADLLQSNQFFTILF